MVMGWESEIRNDVAESKMAREMLRLRSDAKVGSARRRVRAMSALCSRRPRSSPHWNGGLEIA